MAKVYDISEKLKSKDRPKIKIDEDHIFEINTSKNTGILLFEIANDKTITDFKRMDLIIEAGLGKEAFEYIESLNLDLEQYEPISEVIMAAIGNMELEEVQKIAADEKKKIKKK